MSESLNQNEKSLDFVRQIVQGDIESGKHKEIVTRFPPEPNGYLHIGHAKAICLSFGISEEFGTDVPARCHLRFDDTNPEKEEDEYVKAIMEDVRWLGFDWGENLFHASDYFQKLYDFACELIQSGKAYVCDLAADEVRKYRGTLTEPGRNSPFRDRSVEENMELFQQMKAGAFEDGSRVLRAKIDMASPNLNMRDPSLFRIRRAHHQRTGDAWCIYPMYDFTHPLSDALEGITHSLCTLEFENHRPLYDWACEHTSVGTHPRQIEFARLNLTYTVMSKRKLLTLVQEKLVDGWDDPRMPTIGGLRRRGFTPASIRDFCDRIGVAKKESIVDVQLLEHCLREDLNRSAERRMAVLKPLKVTLTNWPEGQVEWLDAVNNPENADAGKRKVPFDGSMWIEQDDFMEDPPKKFFRLGPGREVRFRWAYFVTCNEIVKNEAGEVVELLCTYDPETKGGQAPDGRRVKGTIHWVSAAHARDAEVRLYDHLFKSENPGSLDDFHQDLNSDSLKTLTGCKLEPSLADFEAGAPIQFERLGYFSVDARDSNKETLVFNRSVSLRDSWAKAKKKA
jgi:glutaminyl-tRNA synthetase